LRPMAGASDPDPNLPQLQIVTHVTPAFLPHREPHQPTPVPEAFEHADFDLGAGPDQKVAAHPLAGPAGLAREGRTPVQAVGQQQRLGGQPGLQVVNDNYFSPQ